jgi:flagellar motor switch protein FliN/FliY
MSSTATNLDLVLDIPVKLTVELGSCQLSMREVLQLAPGAIVQLDKMANSPVSVFVNNRLIAKGEVVVVEERLGIKVTEIVGKDA